MVRLPTDVVSIDPTHRLTYASANSPIDNQQ